MIINNIIKSCKNIKINNLNSIYYCQFKSQIIKPQNRYYSNSIKNNINIRNNNNNNNKIINEQHKEQQSVRELDKEVKKIQLVFNGIENEVEIENEYKPKLLKLLREDFKLTQIKEISNQMIDSLMNCSERQIKADQDKLFYFGDLTLRHAVGDPLELPFPDKALFKEFEETVQSEYYLSKRCQEIGLSQFIRFSYSNKWDQYKQVYANNNYYRCLIKFIGALYLEYDFKLVHQFIHKVLLDLPNKQLASILLEKPETVMIKKFSIYKIEAPIIKVINSSTTFPFYTTIINSGSSEISKSFGITKNESYNSAIEFINKQSTTLSSLMSHILKSTKVYNTINDNNNNNNNDNNNNYNNIDNNRKSNNRINNNNNRNRNNK